MFENLDFWKILVLVLIGLFVFGPERLPKLISDGVGMLRQLRRMARNATSDLSRELGTDISIEDLHPKTFVRKHILSDDDQAALTEPFREVYDDVGRTARDLDPNGYQPVPAQPAGGRRRARFDADAT